ncbi:MAG TPA: hypothetical protein VFK54_03565 [Candidatus Limnocylindrales bacterium]|nr:hypothetical protein [Candidatus Limnocylindrales bacterium]
MSVTRHAVARQSRPAAPEPAIVDLHTHTTRSDGVLEPAELVRQVAGTAVRWLAITDHDSLAAYRELTAPGSPPLPPGLELLPGIEINAVTRGLDLPEGELHVLGFGVNPADESFEAALVAQRAARRTRFEEAVRRLREIGLPVDDQVATIDRTRDDSLGRPTLARALVAAGHVASVDQAFEDLLGWGRPGYVPRVGMGPVEAIRAVRAAGGLPVLAHFGAAAERLDLIRELTDAGLAGLESHHRSFDEVARAAVSGVARELGLLETGGTDYHGDLGPYAETHALLVFPAELAERAVAAIRERGAPPEEAR